MAGFGSARCVLNVLSYVSCVVCFEYRLYMCCVFCIMCRSWVGKVAGARCSPDQEV